MKLEHIIVGIDFSAEAEVARGHAQEIAARTGARVTLLHVFEQRGFWPGAESLYEHGDADYENFARAEIEARKDRLAAMCEPIRPELDVTTLVIRGHPGSLIPEVAAEEGADLVVVGTHGRTGFRRLRLGSVAERVVRNTRCSVLVARGRQTAGPYRKILVPTDFSEAAERALEAAVMLLAPDGVIEVLHLWQTPFAASGYYSTWERPKEQRERIERAVRQRCADLVERHRQSHARIVCFDVEGPPARGILERLDSADHELVAMGSHGNRGLRRWIIGSVAENTVRHAPCSVLVVHNRHT